MKIKKKGPQSQVERYGDFLRFTVCEAHNCGHTFYFFIDTMSSKVFICERDMIIPNLHEEADKKLILWVIWYSPNGHVRINNRQCEVYNDKTQEIEWEKTITLIPKEIL